MCACVCVYVHVIYLLRLLELFCVAVVVDIDVNDAAAFVLPHILYQRNISMNRNAIYLFAALINFRHFCLVAAFLLVSIFSLLLRGSARHEASTNLIHDFSSPMVRPIKPRRRSAEETK